VPTADSCLQVVKISKQTAAWMLGYRFFWRKVYWLFLTIGPRCFAKSSVVLTFHHKDCKASVHTESKFPWSKKQLQFLFQILRSHQLAGIKFNKHFVLKSHLLNLVNLLERQVDSLLGRAFFLICFPDKAIQIATPCWFRWQTLSLQLLWYRSSIGNNRWIKIWDENIYPHLISRRTP